MVDVTTTPVLCLPSQLQSYSSLDQSLKLLQTAGMVDKQDKVLQSSMMTKTTQYEHNETSRMIPNVNNLANDEESLFLKGNMQRFFTKLTKMYKPHAKMKKFSGIFNIAILRKSSSYVTSLCTCFVCVLVRFDKKLFYPFMF